MSHNQSPPHPLFGLIFLGTGVFALLVATGVLPTDPDMERAPFWVLGLCGVTFAAAGGSLLGARWPIVRALCLSASILGFGSVAAWITFFAPAAGFDVSGGIPFVSRETNIAIARGLAGFGALLCLVMLVYGWKTGFRPASEIVQEREAKRREATSSRDRSDP